MTKDSFLDITLNKACNGHCISPLFVMDISTGQKIEIYGQYALFF